MFEVNSNLVRFFSANLCFCIIFITLTLSVSAVGGHWMPPKAKNVIMVTFISPNEKNGFQSEVNVWSENAPPAFTSDTCESLVGLKDNIQTKNFSLDWGL